MLPTTTTSRRGTSRTSSFPRATHKKSSSSSSSPFSFPQQKGRWEAKIVRVLALWTIVLLLSNLCFAAFSSSSSSSSLRGGDDAASKYEARVRRRRAKNLAPEDLKFIGQVTSLLEEPVPISLSKRRLRSNLEFTCGGSHVVKMHKYQEMKKQSGVGLLNALANEDWFTEGVDLEDAAADGGEERNTDDGSSSDSSSSSSSSSGSEQKRKKKRYKSCAVVGNSGSLLETQFGFDIDKNEAVIRFNAAVTQGYEQFVGQKTTVRLLNAVDYKGPEGTEDELRLTTARGSDVKVWVKKLEQKPEEMRNKSFVLDPEMLCHAWAWIGKHGEKPSSGLVGVVLALKMCEKVEMFGFQSKNYFGKFSRPHYYDWERPQKGREKVHPFQREVDLYQSLERFGYLTTYT
jgi:hypothetical protein